MFSAYPALLVICEIASVGFSYHRVQASGCIVQLVWEIINQSICDSESVQGLCEHYRCLYGALVYYLAEPNGFTVAVEDLNRCRDLFLIEVSTVRRDSCHACPNVLSLDECAVPDTNSLDISHRVMLPGGQQPGLQTIFPDSFPRHALLFSSCGLSYSMGL